MAYDRGRVERTVALLREPETLEELLDIVSEGGTLREFTRARGMGFMTVHEWIRGDDERSKRYDSAIAIRDAALQDLVLAQLAGASQADVRRLFGSDGTTLEPNQIPDEVAIGVAGVEIDESGARRFKMADRTRNTELLGKALSMFKERVEHSGSMTLEQLLSAAGDGSR